MLWVNSRRDVWLWLGVNRSGRQMTTAGSLPPEVFDILTSDLTQMLRDYRMHSVVDRPLSTAWDLLDLANLAITAASPRYTYICRLLTVGLTSPQIDNVNGKTLIL